MYRTSKYLLSFSLIFLLASCAPPPPEEPPPPTVIEKPKPPLRPVVSLKDRVRTRLKKEDYMGAISLLHRYKKNASLKEERNKTIEAVSHLAQEAVSQHNYQKAGSLFCSLKKIVPKERADEIATKVQLCTDRLMENGLVAYRAGKLNEAIKTWQSIHTFRPKHKISKDAIETSRRQLANLKAMKE